MVNKLDLLSEGLLNEIIHNINIIRKEQLLTVTQKIPIFMKLECNSWYINLMSLNYCIHELNPINYIKSECQLSELFVDFNDVLYTGRNQVYDI